MKTIKIMIAASEEMHDEKVQFQSLINQLNEALASRGIELKRIKWDPEADGSVEEFKAKLKECEMCLTLYWRELSVNAEQELDTAYQELKDGNNPRNLYVFFKEPSDELTESLRDFKASFVNKYGHFFCKFENVDTLNLHFVLQFEKSQNRLQDNLVEVKGGMVSVNGNNVADLSKIPFAAMNKEYQRLQQELLDLSTQLTQVSVRYAANPSDADLLGQLSELGARRKETEQAFEQYQRHLYDIALSFAQLSGEHYTERMVRARELFEMGNAAEADRILNFQQMKSEAAREMALHRQHGKNLELKIEEFLLKVKTVMGNDELSIPDRFAEACEVYEETLRIAKEIRYDEERLTKILFDYAYLLQKFNRMYRAVEYYVEALKMYRQLSQDHPDAYLPYVAKTLNNLAALQADLHRYDEAEQNYVEALKIYRRLSHDHPDAYLPYVAGTLNNLAILQADLHRYEEAESLIKAALDVCLQLESIYPGMYEERIGMYKEFLKP